MPFVMSLRVLLMLLIGHALAHEHVRHHLTSLSSKAATSIDGGMDLILPDSNDEGKPQGRISASSDPRGRRMAETTGVKKMLAVRVIANDASTSASEAEISDSWYGNGNDPVNLKSQYSACSFGKLTVDPFNGTTTTGAIVSNGATTVTINMTASRFNHEIIQDAVIVALEAQLGDLPAQFDHVMLCLPPGTSNVDPQEGDSESASWRSYAKGDHWLSVYNDMWCTSTSNQMHEIGHNLNLDHSGQGADEYGDKSGMVRINMCLRAD
jgi:hypothetical protein